jgi:hypothetical protein
MSVDNRMCRHLNADRIISTIEILNSRINERFPASGLSCVCGELHAVAKESKARSLRISRPDVGLRLVVAMVVILGQLGLLYSISLLEVSTRSFTLVESR